MRALILILVGFLIIAAVGVFSPLLETNKDSPGEYRISPDEASEVFYLSHHYALHRVSESVFISLTHYVGSSPHRFSTGDVTSSSEPLLDEIQSIKIIKEIDGYLIETSTNAALMIGEELEIFTDVTTALAERAEGQWKVGEELYGDASIRDLKMLAERRQNLRNADLGR